MYRVARGACAAGIFLLAAIIAPPRAGAADPECAHIRLDPSIWNTSRTSDLGSAIGQTFLAEDTVITRVTVWRPPNNRSVVGAHLYITGVDANGRPDVGQILLDGPTLTVFDSAPPGQFIELSFLLDPPLALPSPGTYAFFLQNAGCLTAAAWQIVASNANPYPSGMHWLTGRVDNSPCHLRAVIGGEDNTDLLFDIEFCSSGITSSHAKSWGSLKVIYR
jgi:hypothetical protein